VRLCERFFALGWRDYFRYYPFLIPILYLLITLVVSVSGERIVDAF